MIVLAGIDEAGYGPILGPLVVSCSAFTIEDSLLGVDLWQLLRKSTSKHRQHQAGRLLITDSKKAYTRTIGITQLERTILTALRYLGLDPTTYDEIISFLCPDCFSRLQNYPWYRESDIQQIKPASPDIKIASEVFAKDMADNGISLSYLRSFCLDVAYYNHLVSKVKNKANVLFTATASLIQNLWDLFPQYDLQVIIDRQGGRTRYRNILLKFFSEFDLHILRENDTTSTYELKTSDRSMRLHFVTSADERFLPVSLASMASKYIREILMAKINHYFLRFDPSLKPTAGYWKDGLRFVNDLKTKLAHLNYDSSYLIRSR